MEGNPDTPFYLMAERVYSDKCPDNKGEIISGIEKAISNTEKKISDYKKDGAGTSELETHLKSLKEWLKEVRKPKKVLQ